MNTFLGGFLKSKCLIEDIHKMWGQGAFWVFLFTTTLSLDSGCLYRTTLTGLTELPGQVAGDGQTLCQLLFANL